MTLKNPDELVTPTFFHAPGYATTIGPEVMGLGSLCEYHANPEQKLLLEHAFGFDKEGRLPFEVEVIAARQNLKTGFLILQGLGKAVLLKRPLQIWTAHKDSASDEAFLEFERLIHQSSELSKRIKQTTHGKGDKSIRFINGSRIVFRARTGKGGQAMSADDINLDEYFSVGPEHIGSFMPTMSTRKNAQITRCSSAPHATSGVQRSSMSRGRSAALGLTEEPRMVYAEWTTERQLGTNRDGRPIYGPPSCANPECDHSVTQQGCICDDPELIKLANPSLERTLAPSITLEYVRSERRAMEDIPTIFLRERLGVGESPSVAGRAIPEDLWESRTTKGLEPEPTALGIAISLDRMWASIGAVGDGFMGAFRRDRLGPWFLEETIRVAKERSLPVGVDSKGPASGYVEKLREEGVEVVVLSTEDYINACSTVYDGIYDGNIAHGDHDDLNASVAVAGWRQVGERRVWARRGNSDISMLEADTVAMHAATVETRSVYEDRGLVVL